MSCEHEYHWVSQDCNEYGWHCLHCQEPFTGEPPGYSAEFDRDKIISKVESVIWDLVDANFLYFSNSSQLNFVIDQVASWCRRKEKFDQYSIIRRVFKELDHSEYWRDIGRGVRGGNDPRERCTCGNLATIYTSNADGSKNYCESCYPQKKQIFDIEESTSTILKC